MVASRETNAGRDSESGLGVRTRGRDSESGLGVGTRSQDSESGVGTRSQDSESKFSISAFIASSTRSNDDNRVQRMKIDCDPVDFVSNFNGNPRAGVVY
jgi:hypothetical protein